MANCPKCGAPLKEGQKFCTKCGAKIELIPPEVIAQIDILKKRIEKDSLNPKLYIELGDTYLKNNLLPEALIEYQKAISLDASNFDAYLKSGDIYLKLQQLDKAESSYYMALNLNPRSREATIGLFRSYYFQKKIDNAIKLGEEIIKVEPENIEVHQVLKELYKQKDLKDKVLIELEILSSLMPNNKQIFKELATIHHEQNNIERSVKCWHRVLAVDKEDTEALFELGKYYYSMGDYDKTIEYLKSLPQKRELPPAKLSLVHCYLGLAHMNKGNYNYAKNVVEQIAPSIKDLTSEDKKLFGELYYKFGTDTLQKRNLSAAVKYFENAIKYQPENIEYKKQVSYAKSVQDRQRVEAKKKVLRIAISVVVVAIIIFGLWYLSHGKILIKIIPEEEAKVFIDGKPLVVKFEKPGVIATPSLFFGTHKIVIEKDGYEKWEGSASVGLGKKTKIEAKLIPIYGVLKVNSEPSGADVYLNKNFIGKTPLIKEVIYGTYFFELKNENYLPYESTLIIPMRDTLNLYIVLLWRILEGSMEMRGTGENKVFVCTSNAKGGSYSFGKYEYQKTVRFYEASLKMKRLTGDHQYPLEFFFLGGAFGFTPLGNEYYFWETDNHWTGWQYSGNIVAGENEITIKQYGRVVEAYVNGGFVGTFELQQEIGPGKVSVFFKGTPNVASQMQFRDFKIRELLQTPQGVSKKHIYKSGRKNFTVERIHDLEEIQPAKTKLRICWQTGTPGGHCTGGKAYFYISIDNKNWIHIGTEEYPERTGKDDIIHTSVFTPPYPFRYVKVSIPNNYCDFSSAEVNWEE
ncbi:MAG: PEGA domain-containing protein [candidate division WOR-3 bacterium]